MGIPKRYKKTKGGNLDDEGEGGPPRKSLGLHKKKLEKLEIVFDEKSRSEFVNGFRKRRKQRQEYAKEVAKKRHAQEKSEIKRKQWAILDKKVNTIESVKDKAVAMYSDISATSEISTDDTIITTTVTPLFGSNSFAEMQANNYKRKRGDDEEGDGEGEAEEESQQQQEEAQEEEAGLDLDEETSMSADIEEYGALGKSLKTLVPKTKPKRKVPKEDGGKEKKRRKGGKPPNKRRGKK